MTLRQLSIAFAGQPAFMLQRSLPLRKTRIGMPIPSQLQLSAFMILRFEVWQFSGAGRHTGIVDE